MAGASTDGRQAILIFAEHEHDELAAGVDRIHELCEALSVLPVDQRAASIRRVVHWFEAELQPHMAWEESWLFPMIDDRARTPWATRLVRFDHQQISARVERLHGFCAEDRHVRAASIATLVAELSGLEALVRANLEREERFLLPLMEPEADRWAPEWHD